MAQPSRNNQKASQHQDPSPSSTTALKAPKTCVITNGRRKVHSVFMDDSEMVEEFDVITDELLTRKMRKPPTLGGEGVWVFEVGGVTETTRAFNPDVDLIKETSSAPVLVRQDENEHHCWRIRNLPYPADNFDISISDSKEEIVVRTKNKKYFKKIDVPEMKRGGIKLDPSYLLPWEVKHNTLIVRYKKHLAIQAKEVMEKKERATMQATRLQDKPGESSCPQQ